MSVETKIISRCPHCGDRRLAIRYTEVAMAFFDEDPSTREDGHDLLSNELDWDGVWCRGCDKPRKLTKKDIQLIEGE
jgi:hypothetical protein